MAAAIAAIRRGKTAQARRLIQAALRDNPRDTLAWTWACEVATTLEDRIYCLRQILAVDPDHAEARRYLVQLQATLPPEDRRGTARRAPTLPEAPHEPGPGLPLGPDAERAAPSRSISELLLAPLGCLLQISTTHFLVALLVVALVGGVAYYTANTDFFGMAGPDFDSLTISDSYQQFQAADVSWKVTYEKPVDSQFSGLVRGVFPIRESTFRILTHDILVTSGQYADPAIVSTSVLNHHFTWRSSGTARPTGTINLLHTVPASQDIYRQLLEIRSDDEVSIGGREILTIQAYGRDGSYLGEWHDTGCNSLLVKSVSIVHK
jgi:hypothetical protein